MSLPWGVLMITASDHIGVMVNQGAFPLILTLF
jgi:hypothetical protein